MQAFLENGADFESLFEESKHITASTRPDNKAASGSKFVGGGGSMFLDADSRKGRYSVPSSAPPGFQADLQRGTKSNNHNKFGGASASASPPDSSNHGATIMDRAIIGDNLMRSHSAAPSLDAGFSAIDSYHNRKLGRLSVGGGPPGFGGREETPLVSNRTTEQQRQGRDKSYLSESMMERGGLHLAERRSASTGVISQSSVTSSSSVLQSLGLGSSSKGGSGGGGGAVRPAAKTLMDLIQEDFPPDNIEEGEYNPFDRGTVYVDRPRTTSPLSLATRDNLYDREAGSGGLGQQQSPGVRNNSFESDQPGLQHGGALRPGGLVSSMIFIVRI